MLSGKQSAALEAATSWSETQASSLLLHNRPLVAHQARELGNLSATTKVIADVRAGILQKYKHGIDYCDLLVQIRPV